MKFMEIYTDFYVGWSLYRVIINFIQADKEVCIVLQKF